MEFTWNTAVSRATGVAPFTAAHGLPARTVVGSVADENLQVTAGAITTTQVEVLAQAARAYAQTIRQMRTVDKQEAADAANERGRGKPRKYQNGDRVSFFIPPTHDETVRRGRKAKHLLAYRGPAIICKIVSPTTYELSYKSRQYSRATAELRPYHGQWPPAAAVGTAEPIHEPDENNDQRTIKIGKYVAFRESDANSCRRYHVGKVVRVENDEFVLQTHATSTKNPRTAKWKAVYLSSSSQYTLQRPRGARGKGSEVYDHVPCNEEGETDGLIIREVQFQSTGVMKSKDVKELLQEGYRGYLSLGQDAACDEENENENKKRHAHQKPRDTQMQRNKERKPTLRKPTRMRSEGLHNQASVHAHPCQHTRHSNNPEMCRGGMWEYTRTRTHIN